MLRRVSQKGSCLSTDLIPRQAHQRGWVFRGKSMGNIPRGEAWRLDSGKARLKHSSSGVVILQILKWRLVADGNQ